MAKEPVKLYLNPDKSGIQLNTEDRLIQNNIQIYAENPADKLERADTLAKITSTDNRSIHFTVNNDQQTGWPKGNSSIDLSANISLVSPYTQDSTSSDHEQIVLRLTRSSPEPYVALHTSRYDIPNATLTPSNTIISDPKIFNLDDGAGKRVADWKLTSSLNIQAGYIFSGTTNINAVHRLDVFEEPLSWSTDIDGDQGIRIAPQYDDQLIETAGLYCEENFIIEGIPEEYIDTSSGTAVSGDIRKDKIAFVNGNQITGTMPTLTTNDIKVDEGFNTTDEIRYEHNVKIPPFYYTGDQELVIEGFQSFSDTDFQVTGYDLIDNPEDGGAELTIYYTVPEGYTFGTEDGSHSFSIEEAIITQGKPYRSGNNIVCEATAQSGFITSDYEDSDKIFLNSAPIAQLIPEIADGTALRKGVTVGNIKGFYTNAVEDLAVTKNDILEGKVAYVNGSNAIIGTIKTKTATDLRTAEATVIVPSGYYATEVSKSVNIGAVTIDDQSINISSNSVTLDTTQTDGYVHGKVSYSGSLEVSPIVVENGYVTEDEVSSGTISASGNALFNIPYAEGYMNFDESPEYDDETPDRVYFPIDYIVTSAGYIKTGEAPSDGPKYLGLDLLEDKYYEQSPQSEEVTIPTANRWCKKAIKIHAMNLKDLSAITPTNDEQQFYATDEGCDGFSSIIVDPIPDDYIIPWGNLDINTNNTYDVSSYATVTVNIPATSYPSVTTWKYN